MKDFISEILVVSIIIVIIFIFIYYLFSQNGIPDKTQHHLTFDKSHITKFCYENKEFIAFSNDTAIINLNEAGKPIPCESK